MTRNNLVILDFVSVQFGLHMITDVRVNLCSSYLVGTIIIAANILVGDLSISSCCASCTSRNEIGQQTEKAGHEKRKKLQAASSVPP